MSAKPGLTYHGLVSGMADAYNDPRGPRLQVVTPSGQIREVPLTRAELIGLIRAAAGALAFVEKENPDA